MTPAEPTAFVDADGLHLPQECTEILDVLFDDQRVWTVTAARQAVREGHRHLPWPPRLVPLLTGQTRLVLREHVSGRVWLDTDHSFDDTSKPTSVRDDEGFPLAIDKWGFLVRTFGTSDSGLAAALLDDLEALLAAMHELGLPAFIAYGTLLGAVRAGTFLGHDNDADISYVSAYEHPSDITCESFRIERGLRAAGWEVFRSTGGFLQVSRNSEDDQRKIDIFTGYFHEGCFAVERWVRAPMKRASLLPLGTVTLAGRELPAPACPEDLLAATYGESWQVPDPGFSFRTRRVDERRSSGWFGEFWRGEGRRDQDEPEPTGVPSAFVEWVIEQLAHAAPVVDFGCGTGVDLVHLAAAGHRVIGLDFSAAALEVAADRVAEAGVEARLERLSLEDLRSVLTAACRLAVAEGPQVQAVARMLLNDLSATGRDHLWRACRVLLGGGGQLLLEYAGVAQTSGSISTPGPALMRAEIERGRGRVLTEESVEIDGIHLIRMVVDWSIEAAAFTTAPAGV